MFEYNVLTTRRIGSIITLHDGSNDAMIYYTASTLKGLCLSNAAIKSVILKFPDF